MQYMSFLVTVLTLRFKIGYFPGLSKDEVSKASPKADSKEEPSIVSHSDQHEDVGQTHLYHM